MVDLDIADLLLFAVVNTVNIMTFSVFISRVKLPRISHKLAIATTGMAIPTIAVAALNAKAGSGWLSLVMPLIFIAWAVFALTVDIIRKQEFRQPRNPKILVPFLLLFYMGLGGMGALTWQIGVTFWAITAVTFVLQFGAMAYAFRHGKG